MERLRLLPEIAVILLFAAVSFFSLLVAYVYGATAGIQQSTSNTTNLLYVILIIAVTMIMTGAILYFSQKRGIRLIRGIFIIVSIYATFIVSYAVAALVVSVIPMGEVAALPVFLIIWFTIPGYLGFMALTSKSFIIGNIIGFMLSAGFAAVWGLTLDVWFTVGLLIIFACYDYIAVYKTKHMIKLADLATSSSLNMLFVIPASRGFDPSAKFKENRGEGTEPDGEKGILLGFGDVALPNVMIISSTIYGNYQLFPFFYLPLLGAVAGILVLMFFTKRPAPGLPLLNAGVIIGFLLALFIPW